MVVLNVGVVCMQYQGGKSRIAGVISAYISDALYRGGYFRRYGDGDKAQVLKNAGGGTGRLYHSFVAAWLWKDLLKAQTE